MWIAKKGLAKLPELMILWLLLWFIIPGEIFAGKADRALQGTSESQVNFVLTIEENGISLHAEEASLKEIIEAIGRRMNIEVVSHTSQKERVTIEFDGAFIEEAIKTFRRYANIVYLIEDSKNNEAKISKIQVFPKDEITALSRPSISASETRSGDDLVSHERIDGNETIQEKLPRAESFKFEFDPSKFIEERK